MDNIFKNIDIINKIDFIKREKYGENLEIIVNKMKNTMIEKYGVDNISKLEKIKDIKKNKMINSGNWYKPYKNDYLKYRYRVDYLTKKNIKLFLESWDGRDYYDFEYIIPYYNLNINNILQQLIIKYQ